MLSVTEESTEEPADAGVLLEFYWQKIGDFNHLILVERRFFSQVEIDSGEALQWTHTGWQHHGEPPEGFTRALYCINQKGDVG